MGQLFDRALRKGFSDVFDSAYGGSALENRLKGALASSLYDARLSSSGYNKARTKTVEDELANRQELLKRAMAGSDPTAVDRVLAGPGHAQDQMKGRVGAEERKDVVSELQRLENLGTSEGTAYRRGHIFGDSSSEIASGLVHGIKGEQIISNKARVDEVLGDIRAKGLDVKSKEGQANLLELILKGDVKGTDVKNLLTTESKIALTEAKKTTEGSKQTLNASKSGYYDSAAALKDEQIFTEEFKQDRFFALELLADEKVNQVKSQIKTNKKKIEAQIKVLMQKKQSGEIKDKEVMAKTDLLIEQGYSEILKQEKILATVAKLHKEADKWDEVIKKTRAQTKAEELDMGLALMEFLGLDTKTASGDSMRNNYTKMYVKIMEEDPILREPDPDNPGQERDIVINITDDNPEGQKKLFSHLNADDQKTYIQSRLIDERQQSYAMAGKTLNPKIKAIVDSMMESFTKPGEAITNELMNMPDGEEKSTAYSVSPQDNKNRMNMPVQPQTAGQPPAAVDGSDLASALGQFAGTGEMQFDDSQVADALQASNAGVQDDLTAVQSVPTDVPGGNITARQDAGRDEALQKMVTENGWSSNIATIFSDAIATQVISPVSAEKLAKMSVVQLQELITAQQGNKNFATDILPIVQAMIADKQAGG